MKNRQIPFYLIILSGLVLLNSTQTSVGQELEIHLKSKKTSLKGSIVAESIAGITLADGKKIPSTDISDINYEQRLESSSARLTIYKPAAAAEDRARKTTPENQPELYMEAASAYRDSLGKLDAKYKYLHRHFEFKVAYLTAQAALAAGKEKPKNISDAVTELKKFKAKHTNSWQYTPTMLMLAELELLQNQTAEARKVYQELADTPGIAEDVKKEVEFKNIKLYMEEDQYAEAQNKLKLLIPRLEPGTIRSFQARMAEIQCMAGQKQFKEAVGKIQEIQENLTAEDKEKKALAYNTLGEIHFQKEEMDKARWPFLWVDVIYNQDAKQHARALYYLNKIFYSLREYDRADECFQQLTTDPRFSGSEFRKKALAERKKEG